MVLIVFTQGVALLFGDGAAAYYSIKLGEKNKEEGARGIGNAISMLVISGIVIFIFGYIFLERLLWKFGATSTNFLYAFDYMKIVIFSIPFTMVACGLSSIIRADGSPGYGMTSLLTGTILNFILDPIFIFGFHMGVEGAAIATLIGETVSCIISLNYLRRFKNIRFNKKLLRLDFKITRTIIIFGVPTFITQIAVTLIVIVSNNMLAQFGAQSVYGSDITQSAVGIVMKVNDILIGIVIGIAVGGQPVLGYNFGAKNYKRVKDVYFVLVKMASVVSIVGFICFQFFPQYIIRIFGAGDVLYNEFAVKSFKIFLMLCIFIGFELVTCIFFQAIGKTEKAIILTLCKQTIFIIPLMIILPRYFGVEGVLYAGPVAEILSVIAALLFIRGQFKEFDKMLI